jgi:hypothetical protein
LIVSATKEESSLKLLTVKSLDFPSASGIEYYNDQLYVFGDNATHLLILSTNYNVVKKIPYWKSKEDVIDKESKPDVESAMLLERNKQPLIVGVGSMSDKNRWFVFELSPEDLTITQTRYFSNNTSFPGIQERNIEGSTQVGNTLVFCNRANNQSKRNHLIFWNGSDRITTKEMLLPKSATVIGLSGLYYLKEKDVLLFTASEEATSSAVQDGAIGDSYLGWITDFSGKMQERRMQPDKLLKLSTVDRAFEHQKIESLCLEEDKNGGYLLHLVADNDNNKSKLFKLSWKPSEW